MHAPLMRVIIQILLTTHIVVHYQYYSQLILSSVLRGSKYLFHITILTETNLSHEFP